MDTLLRLPIHGWVSGRWSKPTMKEKNMKIMNTKTSLLGLFFLFVFNTSSNAQSSTTLTPDEAKAKQAYALGATAYIWYTPAK